MATQPLTCGNAECNFASDGKCVEGLTLDECPHLRRISIEDIQDIEEAVVGEVAAEIAEPTVELDSGEPLDRGIASDLQRRRVSRSIGLIGANESGKTSLIAGLYDLLQSGPLEGVSFAGSSTLIGFEQVCHLARAASRRTTPHTERTTVGVEATFFHLDLQSKDREVVSLFVSDRSGEDYLAATDQLSRAEEFFELRRADCVTLLVNGEQLADGEKRHEVKAATPQIVDALVEAGAIRQGCRLAIVLTKKDTVLKSLTVERTTGEFDKLVADMSARHGNYFGEVRSFSVAASPKDSEEVTRGEGIGELLLFWLQDPLPQRAIPIGGRADMPRAIDRFGSGKELVDDR
jgi:hypothetical protein